MRRIRMERLDIEDLDPSTMSILSLQALPTISNTGDVDWVCGHCDETLIQRASDGIREAIVLRCPRCFRFCRFLQVH